MKRVVIHGVNIKVARIFNTYGPRMHPNDGRVISNFIMQALKNEPITIYGDGAQTRSFCYVDDLISAILKLMDTAEGFTGPINLGNPKEFTIRELANQIAELTGAKMNIKSMPMPADDPKQRQPDISLAQKELEWSPAIELKDGLVMTIEYFKKLIQEG